jgi:ABC-type xylose transport system permease subunit
VRQGFDGFGRKWIATIGMGLSGALLAVLVASNVSPPDKFSLGAVIALGAVLGAAFGRWIATK